MIQIIKIELRNFLKWEIYLVGIFIFLMLFLNTFVSPNEMGYWTNEWVTILFGLSYTTYIYQKYNNESFIKITEMNDLSPTNFKLLLVMLALLGSIIIWSTYLGIFFIFEILGLMSYGNIVGMQGVVLMPVEWSLIFSTSSKWWYLYSATMEISLLVAFGYFINRIFKDSTIVFGIIIIVSFWYLLYNGFISGYKFYILDSGTGWINKARPSNMTMISFILMPWSQIGIMSKSFYRIVYDTGGNVNWFDYSNLGFWTMLSWTPYVSLLGLILLPSIPTVWEKQSLFKVRQFI